MGKFVYFASFSSGNSRQWLLENTPFHNGSTCRFYDKSYDPLFYHPYTLLSAGPNYRNMDLRKQFGAEREKGVVILGDSGGYQIATGALKWKEELREQIFNWLENNSDIAMNIDIPPVGTFAGRHEEALKLSLENFKWFEKNQTGKTRYLNIAQMTSEEGTIAWYNKVRGLDFHGWSVGTGASGPIKDILYISALLQANGEYDNPKCKYLHYLGNSSPHQLFTFFVLQKALNERYNNQITVMSDSSSPNLATVYGNYYTTYNWKTFGLNSVTITKKDVDSYKMDMPLPCTIQCPACNGSTYEHIKDWKYYSYMVMTNHNLNVLVHGLKFLEKMVNSHDAILKEFLPTDYYMLYNAIHEMVHSDKPLFVYNKYKNLFMKIKDRSIIRTGDAVPSEFFEF